MAINIEKYNQIRAELAPRKVTLVAVSKTKPVEDILALYEAGQRDFGENYVQELVEKAAALPKDIRWHFIGHLQTNKVKFIAPFVQLIQGVDSLKLLAEINKQGERNQRPVNCLLQVHIAREETKFGLDEGELDYIRKFIETTPFPYARVQGLMGMASFTANEEDVRAEFRRLKEIFDASPGWSLLSMGMSGDYRIAIEAGSNMVRIGSILFGERRNAE